MQKQFQQSASALTGRPRGTLSSQNVARRRLQLRRYQFESLETRCLMAVDTLQFDASHYDPNSFLVQFQPTETSSAVIGTTVAGAKVTRQVSSDGWYQATLLAGADLNGSMQAFQQLSNVITAAPDFRVAITAVPNDPSYASQWALENSGVGGRADADIDAAQAWNYGTSSSVVVAVIDTGVDYNHVDLAANIWTNPREIVANGVDDDLNGYIDDTRGWNFVANNNNPMDDNGHGTHVAGTIGAVGNNGIGASGVAWNVKMMALKFLDAAGSGLLSDAVSAIDYARVNGAKIINASWGGGGFSSALESAIQRYQSIGGIFVAAAGNEGTNNVTVASYPANYSLSNVISVAASTNLDTLASFSNFGTNVDIAAPGQAILSTIPGNQYASYSGTSMATPNVSGALALLWGQKPSLTATQLVDLVMSNTDSVLLDKTIHGRLNVGKASVALNGSGTVSDKISPHVVAATWNYQANGVASVDVTFSESMRATSLTATSLQVTGPSGAIAIASIAPLTNSALASGTQWRITFTNQTVAGKYALTVLPTVTDAAGNALDQDRDGVAGESVQDRFVSGMSLVAPRTYTTSGPYTLLDATSNRLGITTILVDVTDAFSISDLNVNLSIDHTYVSDLSVRLIAPDGTSVQLVTRRGGSRDNLRVVFDDEAVTSVVNVTGNLQGTLRPERALSAFDGKNAQGRWRLEVTDWARWDVGRFNGVTLQFGGSAAATAISTNPPAVTPGSSSTAAWLGYVADVFDWLRRR